MLNHLFKLVFMLASTYRYFVLLFLTAILGTKLHAMVVMTQNLRCLPNGEINQQILPIEQRIERLLNHVLYKQVDILLLQEVCSNKQSSALEMLLEQSAANNIKWNFVLTTFAHNSYGQWREELVILSKNFPLATSELSLPDPVLGRVLQALYIPQLELWVANTHLSHADDRGHQRQQQMQTIVDHFADNPVVILGDFNSGPRDPESYIFRQSGYRPYFNGPSWPAHAPEFHYDGLWAAPTANFRIIATKFVDIGSDHLGLIFQLSTLF